MDMEKQNKTALKRQRHRGSLACERWLYHIPLATRLSLLDLS